MTIRPPVPLSSLSPGDILALESDIHKAYSLVGFIYSRRVATISAFAWQDNNIWYRYNTQPKFFHTSSSLAYLLSPSLNPVGD